MKSKMKMRQWIVLGIWFAAYMAALQFYRFKFGLNKISAVFLLVGIPFMLLVSKWKKPNAK